MKMKWVLSIVIVTLLLSSCTITPDGITINPEKLIGSGKIVTESRDVSGFNRVDLQGVGNLTITTGDVESLTIKADDNIMPYITSKVEDSTLVIDIKPNWTLDPSNDIEYALVVKDLESITLSGFGDISADEFTGDDLQVRLAGSGDIRFGSVESNSLEMRLSGFGDIDIEKMMVDRPTIEITGSGDLSVAEVIATDLDVQLNGFGNIELAGSVSSQSINVKGSGDYNAGDLESEIARIEISGFGGVKVWVTEKMEIKINGSGDVEYYGFPRISQTLTGFGKVNSLGEK